MAERLATIKRLVKVAVSTVAIPVPRAQSHLRGKDFMVDDLTVGADRDGH